MSFDLEVATYRIPTTTEVAEVITRYHDLQMEGELGPGTNLLVERRTSSGTTPLFTIDGPTEVDASDIPEPLAAAVLAPRWLVTISTPEGARPLGVRVGRTVAQHVADRCEGAVYDPQTEEVIWPRGHRRRYRPPTRDKRIAVLWLEWVFPLSRLDLTAPHRLLYLLRRILPEAVPKRYNGHRLTPGDEDAFYEFWREEAESPRPWTSWSWTAEEPCYGGSVYVKREADWPAAGSLPAWSISIAFDMQAPETHSRWSDAIASLFAAIAEQLGAVYAAGYVRHGYLVERGRLFTDDQTEDLFIPIWNGIPSFPTWLAWFGRPYAERVWQTVQGFPVEQSPEGIFYRATQRPVGRDECASLFPRLPPSLLQRSRAETTCLDQGSQGRPSELTRFVHEVADIIPQLE